MTATRRPANATGPLSPAPTVAGAPRTSAGFSELPGSTGALDSPPSIALPEMIGPIGLVELLEPIAEELETSALEVVLDSARALGAWTRAWPDGWDAHRVGVELERGWASWIEVHGWRGPCARFVDTVRRLWWRHADADLEELRGLFGEELGLWTWSVEEGLERFGEHDVPWNGEPLARGRRMPLRRDAARHAAETLARGETVLVAAWSDTLATALELAWKQGKAPHLLMGEGLPLLDGRRMARRLVEEGVLATLVYDSALASVVRRADRVWIGAEALGARELTTRVGTRELLRVAREHDVPVDLVTTSDKLVPGGALELPRWCAKRPDLLWEDACEGVRLELDCFETVPLDLLPRPITELGRESLAELALRALLPDASPPCAALAREPS